MNEAETEMIKGFNDFIREIKKEDRSTTKQVNITLGFNLWPTLEAMKTEKGIDIEGLLSGAIMYFLAPNNPLKFADIVCFIIQAGAETHDNLKSKKETPFDDLLTTNKGEVHGKEEGKEEGKNRG